MVKAKTKNKKTKIYVGGIIVLVIIISLIALSWYSESKKIPCVEIFENGVLISDNCSSESYCVSGTYSSDPKVRSGERVVAEGYCEETSKGIGSIGI